MRVPRFKLPGAGGDASPKARKEPVVEADQEKQLIELFNNRNEIKRAYDRVVGERDRLLAEVTSLRQSYERVSKRLDSLDRTLGDPERSGNVLAYFALSSIWDTCRDRLMARSRRLRKSFEEAERSELMSTYKAEQMRELGAQKKRLEEIEAERDTVQARKRDLENQLARSQQLWHYFKRKRLREQVNAERRQLTPIEHRYGEQLKALEEIQDREAPRYPGLSTVAKRKINLELIAEAQHYYLHFVDNDLSALAHTAHAKMPHEVNFGNLEMCLRLQRQALKALARLQEEINTNELVEKRLPLIERDVRFESDDAAIPVASSVGGIRRLEPGGADGVMDRLVVNVLDLDSWNLESALVK